MKKTHSKSWFEVISYDEWNDFNNDIEITVLQIKDIPSNYLIVETMFTKNYKGGTPC